MAIPQMSVDAVKSTRNPVAPQSGETEAKTLASTAKQAPAAQKQAPKAPVTDVVVQKTPAEMQAEINALKTTVSSMQKALGKNTEQTQRVTDSNETRRLEEDRAAEEAESPGFMRSLMDIFMTLSEFISPFTHLLSLIVQTFRVLYRWYQADFDWDKTGMNGSEELSRFVASMVGMWIPAIGGAANLFLNVYDPFDQGPAGKGQSYYLGGINQFFDDDSEANINRRAKVGSPIRMLFNGAMDMGGKAYDAATGAESTKAVEGAATGGQAGDVNIRSKPADTLLAV